MIWVFCTIDESHPIERNKMRAIDSYFGAIISDDFGWLLVD